MKRIDIHSGTRFYWMLHKHLGFHCTRVKHEDNHSVILCDIVYSNYELRIIGTATIILTDKDTLLPLNEH